MKRDATRNKILCFLIFASLLWGGVLGAASAEIRSPNGKVSACVKVSDGGILNFDVFLRDNDNNISFIKNGRLGLKTNLSDFSEKLKIASCGKPKEVRDSYKMISGKRSACKNAATEKILRVENENGRLIDIAIRAYNDGVAVKYALDASEGERILDEFTSYPIADGKKRWISKYDPRSYENFYELATDGKKNDWGNSWAYPALAEVEDSYFMLITEAGILRGNCASLLKNEKKSSEYKVVLAEDNVEIKGGWQSAWRVVMLGRLEDIVESTLVNDVSEPCSQKDVGWIDAGVASWIYWAHNYGSKDFQIVKQYIDLADCMGWKYCLIDWQWDRMSNGGNIEDAIKYANEKGVKLLLWYNSSTALQDKNFGPLYRLNGKETREKEFKWLSEKGIAGIKVDFFDGDRVETVNYYLDLLETAQKYKIMLNFHGATIPRGWQRTYPHLMTVEGVYGAEWYNNAPVLTNRAAAHNAVLPFTRNVVGSMDYTPGTFTDSQHKHITTHAHELALIVLFESALQHMPDRPSAYKNLPDEVRGFLSELPAAWDDTKLLAGYPEKEAVIARRKGKTWYIAGLNGTDESRVLEFSLSKLKNLGKEALLFKDGKDGKSFDIQKAELKKEMKAECLPRGGFVLVVKEQKK